MGFFAVFHGKLFCDGTVDSQTGPCLRLFFEIKGAFFLAQWSCVIMD